MARPRRPRAGETEATTPETPPPASTPGDGGEITGRFIVVFKDHAVEDTATAKRVLSGTSMATPHVSGIAALWCQATGATGTALWARLEQSARPLRAPAVDVGFGLVQAPQ